MGLTLSHLSALDVMRRLRCDGIDVRSMDSIPLRRPSTWVGRRWGAREFGPDSGWKWGSPSPTNPLHILIPNRVGRVRMGNVTNHIAWQGLPPGSILWVDDTTSIVCPELLFLQMASVLSTPMLVLLGYELCGYFSRCAEDPLNGPVTMPVSVATSVEDIRAYLLSCAYAHMASKAWAALSHVSDFALSAPEAVLATLYSLPVAEAGYAMGPVTLNAGISPSTLEDDAAAKLRFPDLMFTFAPVGINYDGEDHLDLAGLVQAVRDAQTDNADAMREAMGALEQKRAAVRQKVVDDMRRNRELMARGKAVLTATKEDLYGYGNLDVLTLQILATAHNVFGANVDAHVSMLENTEQKRDRNDLLASMLPGGMPRDASHGQL